jgi:hypothetical protein
MGDADESKCASEHLEKQHMEWTSKQGHILSGGGMAEEFFTPERGFSFEPCELPHHHLIRKETHEVFNTWRSSKGPCSLVTGAWNRPLFVGGWLHTTDEDESVYNVQTHNLFVDIRIPRSRENILLADKFSSIQDLNPLQLKIYARQHIFAGFSVFALEGGRPLCTRHHCIDWNFVGTPRSRPNKWWIKMNGDGTKWKENSYATDEDHQYYYCERWERLNTAQMPRLALRKSGAHQRDGIFVLVGDHFNYVLSRNLVGNEKEYPQKTLVDLVDAAVSAGDLATARSYLSIEGGHGRVSNGWKLDCAIPPWNEGNKLWTPDDLKIEGDSIESCRVLWGREEWEIYDCSFESKEELRDFLMQKSNN